MKGKLTVKQLCTIAMLIALTAVLSCIAGNLRIGNAVKFSVSFVSVYVSGALFGPVWGGFVGAAADVISHFANPVGAYLWQLTLIELVYGALYGVFFWRSRRKKIKTPALSVLLCVLIQFLINVFLKTYILKDLGFMGDLSFAACILTRLLSCLFMVALQFVTVYVIEKRYIDKFYELSR